MKNKQQHDSHVKDYKLHREGEVRRAIYLHNLRAESLNPRPCLFYDGYWPYGLKGGRYW